MPGLFRSQLVRTTRSISRMRLTIRAVDAGVLVVTQEEPFFALALVTAHGVEADLLTAAVVVQTFVHI